MKQKIRELLGLPISSPIDYFCRYWKDYAEKLDSDDEYMVTLDSPRIVIDSIISEVQYNGCKNKDNISCFRDRLGKLCGYDISLMSICGDKIKLLLDQLSHFNTPMVEELSKQVFIDLNDKKYIDLLIQNSITYIDNPSTSLNYKSKQKMNYFAGLLIAELLFYGYGFDEIKTAMEQISDIIIATGNHIIYSPDRYYEIHREDYDCEEKFHEDIAKRIKSRSVSEHFDNLRQMFSTEYKEAIVLFRMKGLQGDEEIQIGDITFYSPHHRKFISEEKSISKLEDIPIDKELRIINAAIPVRFRSLYEARIEAATKLDQAIGILTLAYNPKIPISYNRETLAVIEDGKFTAGSIGDLYSQEKKLRFDTYSSKSVSEIQEDTSCFEKQLEMLNGRSDMLRLKNSMNWFKKASSSSRAEEKLLFCWFSLESLLNIDSVVKESLFTNSKENHGTCSVIRLISSEILSNRHFCKSWYNAFINVYYATRDNDNYYDFTEDTIVQSGLSIRPGEKINKDLFLSNIAILIHESNDELLKNKLEEIRQLYQDSFAIKAYYDSVDKDVLMIYRLRNLIVHNAVISPFAVNYYSKKAIFIAHVVLNVLLHKLLGSNENMLDNTILKSHIEYILFDNNFESKINKKQK